jgi:sugar/nucleoside kinase (ribokinase family)
LKKHITTIGNLTIDDVVLHDEHKTYFGLVGGDAIYSAIGASIWGNPSKIQARIGNSFPQSSFNQFEKFGIDADLVKVDKNDIRFWGLYEPGGDRQFANHLASGSHADLSIVGDELLKSNLQVDGIHLAPMPTEIQYGVLKRIDKDKGNNTVVSWDPQVDYLAQPENNQMAFDMLTFVDIFLPSKEEVLKMFGSNDLKKAARVFANHGPTIVAIKKGIEGSLIYVKETDMFWDMPIFPCQAIDPTGAGDAYCGGFLSGYLETMNPIVSAAYGTVSASYVVETVGALASLNQSFKDRESRLKIVEKNIINL